MSKCALILGITGQDGSYLADVLLKKGYEVHGLYRKSSVDNLYRIKHILGSIRLHPGDMADPQSVERAIVQSCPEEIYNEADQDSVGWSHNLVSYQMDITATAVARLLEMVRNLCKSIKVFQPCSATMFGDAVSIDAQIPQNEKTPFNPQSPYACAKVAAYYLCRHYRQQHGMFVSTGILFNHDSPRRSEDYLLHKVCKGAVRIGRGLQKELALGNLDGRVDIGYSLEYMEAAHAILQLNQPDDFVIGTERAYTVEEMVKEAFNLVGVSIAGKIAIDQRFYKPGAKSHLVADCAKARNAFGFDPQWDAKKLIKLLVYHAGLEADKEMKSLGLSLVRDL